MIKSDKRLRILLVIIISLVLTIMLGFEINVLGETKVNRSSNDFTVVVKENELWAVNLLMPNEKILIDNLGVFKNPSISTDGHNVAYTKGEELYISPISFNQGKKEIIRVSENIISYGWVNDDEIGYSTKEGGLNGFNVKSKSSFNYIKSNDQYNGLVGDGQERIYGHKYRVYAKDGDQYIEDEGVISYDLAKRKEKLIIPSIPINLESQGLDVNLEDLGFLPEVAGISEDGDYVYIWSKVQSASTNADGVGFGVYDVKNNKYTAFDKEKIFALAYKDNLAISPVDGRLPVINNGGVRNMNINKTLGVVDVINGTFTSILPKNMISSHEPYGIAVRGIVTMTPSFSPDGKKVIFSASNAMVDMQQWAKEPHNIYTAILGTNKVKKITEGNTFDFAPRYISKGEAIVFARKEEGHFISLWKIQDNNEELIASDIKLDEISWYYGHYDLEGILDFYIS